jgi:hypothetical protein
MCSFAFSSRIELPRLSFANCHGVYDPMAARRARLCSSRHNGCSRCATPCESRCHKARPPTRDAMQRLRCRALPPPYSFVCSDINWKQGKPLCPARRSRNVWSRSPTSLASPGVRVATERAARHLHDTHGCAMALRISTVTESGTEGVGGDLRMDFSTRVGGVRPRR